MRNLVGKTKTLGRKKNKAKIIIFPLPFTPPYSIAISHARIYNFSHMCAGIEYCSIFSMSLARARVCAQFLLFYGAISRRSFPFSGAYLFSSLSFKTCKKWKFFIQRGEKKIFMVVPFLLLNL